MRVRLASGRDAVIGLEAGLISLVAMLTGPVVTLTGLVVTLTGLVLTRRVRARLGLRAGVPVAACGASRVVGHDTAGYQSVANGNVPNDPRRL